jgi:hypothetical protein
MDCETRFSPWVPAIYRCVSALLDQRRHLRWIPDPTFDCDVSEVIPDPLPCHSFHVVYRTIAIVAAYLQLTHHPHRCLWHHADLGWLILGDRQIARVDLGWAPPPRGLRLTTHSDGSIACWSPHGGRVWLGFHVVVLGWAVTDLTRWSVTHIDGDLSNYRSDNLRMERTRGGEVRQLCFLSNGALRVNVLGKTFSSKIRAPYETPWDTLDRVLRKSPTSSWTDFRGNLLGLER